MLADSVTVPRVASAASAMSRSKSVSPGPTLVYKTVLPMAV
jgi:hypothetical protein